MQEYYKGTLIKDQGHNNIKMIRSVAVGRAGCQHAAQLGYFAFTNSRLRSDDFRI